MDSPSTLTELLAGARDGNTAARTELLNLVYGQLRHLAAGLLDRERPDHTLQATALVHEALLKLGPVGGLAYRDRQHFFRTAAQAMRRILVDHARAHLAAKRGGPRRRVALEDCSPAAPLINDDILAVHEALAGLTDLDPRAAEIVELRFFGGLTIEETAEVVGLSAATVKREWTVARAWLHRAISPATESDR